ncbi:MAG TPA: hypothetical protein VGC74_02560 [Stenotrophomonas sp.]
MFDARVDTVDSALAGLSGDGAAQADLWSWACREMLHETQTGMHQLSCRAGIDRHVAHDWRAPVDVIEPARPYLDRAVFADARLQTVNAGLDDERDAGGRARLWRSRYVGLISATLQGMRGVAARHRISTSLPTDS